MKHALPPDARRAAVAIAFAAAIAPHAVRGAFAHGIEAPLVPAELQVGSGAKPFMRAHATGTQNYVCLPTPSGYAWSLFTPQATLVDAHDDEVISHYFAPEPGAAGVVRPAWRHVRDGSTVWAQVVKSSEDARFVSAGAIPWLLLKTAAVQGGNGSAGMWRGTAYVQRVNTAGGQAPSGGCAGPTDVGRKAFVPYAADYVFYTER